MAHGGTEKGHQGQERQSQRLTASGADRAGSAASPHPQATSCPLASTVDGVRHRHSDNGYAGKQWPQLPRSSTGTRLNAGVPLSGSLTARINPLASG
jgi:hypothetical protein